MASWAGRGKPSALDVGCGPGYVMEILADMFDVQGIDIDPATVAECERRALNARVADAHSLPFDDESFDLAYCSFLLLWVKNPEKVLSEMMRVSRSWIVCLAEPDFGARIDYPKEFSVLARIAEDGVRAEGGDPLIGRKLRSIFHQCGLDSEIGIHPGVWGIEKLREEAEAEWRYLELTARGNEERARLDELHPLWVRALEDGSLFQFSPVFYAFARKNDSHC